MRCKTGIGVGVSLTPRHLVQAQMTERLDELENVNLHARCDIGHFEGERGMSMHVAANENLPAMILSLVLD